MGCTQLLGRKRPACHPVMPSASDGGNCPPSPQELALGPAQQLGEDFPHLNWDISAASEQSILYSPRRGGGTPKHFAPPQGGTTLGEVPILVSPLPSLCTPALTRQVHDPYLQYFIILHHHWAATFPPPTSELSWEIAGSGFRWEVTTPSAQAGGTFKDFIPQLWFFFFFTLSVTPSCLRWRTGAKTESFVWVYCILQGAQYPIQVAMSLQIKSALNTALVKREFFHLSKCCSHMAY